MRNTATTIQFTAALYTLKDQIILSVPGDESEKLPSRGQISVDGVMNGCEFQTVLEPDGRWGHWMRVGKDLQKQAGVVSGDTVSVTMTTRQAWPEPVVPEDFARALDTAPQKVKDKWKDITPMARWEWIRWVHATASTETRQVRIEKTISKLDGKHRRPCCFNLAACTDPYLSKSGRLIEPAA